MFVVLACSQGWWNAGRRILIHGAAAGSCVWDGWRGGRGSGVVAEAGDVVVFGAVVVVVVSAGGWVPSFDCSQPRPSLRPRLIDRHLFMR